MYMVSISNRSRLAPKMTMAQGPGGAMPASASCLLTDALVVFCSGFIPFNLACGVGIVPATVKPHLMLLATAPAAWRQSGSLPRETSIVPETKTAPSASFRDRHDFAHSPISTSFLLSTMLPVGVRRHWSEMRIQKYTRPTMAAIPAINSTIRMAIAPFEASMAHVAHGSAFPETGLINTGSPHFGHFPQFSLSSMFAIIVLFVP
jgi:hypothetical protein